MTSPLANLADQTAELLATIAGLTTIEQLRDAMQGMLAPEGVEEAADFGKAPVQRAARIVGGVSGGSGARYGASFISLR